MKNSWADSEAVRFSFAALLVFGLLLWAGVRWIPSPGRPGTARPVHVPHVAMVLLYPRPKVNLNTADPEQLIGLTGIGTVLAERIVNYREEHGAFPSVEALLEVRGIGPALLEGVRDHVTVD